MFGFVLASKNASEPAWQAGTLLCRKYASGYLAADRHRSNKDLRFLSVCTPRFGPTTTAGWNEDQYLPL